MTLDVPDMERGERSPRSIRSAISVCARRHWRQIPYINF
jgi:hypothetical protein